MKQLSMILIALVFLLSGCQTRLTKVVSTTGDLTVEIDKTLQPTLRSMGESKDGKPRMLATFSDADRGQEDFFEDELIVIAKDSSALEVFLNRWGGTIIQDLGNIVSPEAFGEDSFSVRSTRYLVRLDPGMANPALVNKLADNLKKTNPTAHGRYRISSYKGMQLLAILAAEKNKLGMEIDINWMNYGDAITFERLKSDDLLRAIFEENGGIDQRQLYFPVDDN